MTPVATHSTASNAAGWLTRGTAWLDSKGRGAWIAALVLALILFWPVGLALLAYMIWSNRLFGASCARRTALSNTAHSVGTPTGNRAFDAYKSDTLARLEREQHEFEAFLERLREAKDKAEFDQFMNDRARRSAEATRDAPDNPRQSED